jgi:hypothetical protein
LNREGRKPRGAISVVPVELRVRHNEGPKRLFAYCLRFSYGESQVLGVESIGLANRAIPPVRRLQLEKGLMSSAAFETPEP